MSSHATCGSELRRVTVVCRARERGGGPRKSCDVWHAPSSRPPSIFGTAPLPARPRHRALLRHDHVLLFALCARQTTRLRALPPHSPRPFIVDVVRFFDWLSALPAIAWHARNLATTSTVGDSLFVCLVEHPQLLGMASVSGRTSCRTADRASRDTRIAVGCQRGAIEEDWACT